jgi:hypothetical protein
MLITSVTISYRCVFTIDVDAHLDPDRLVRVLEDEPERGRGLADHRLEQRGVRRVEDEESPAHAHADAVDVGGLCAVSAQHLVCFEAREHHGKQPHVCHLCYHIDVAGLCHLDHLHHDLAKLR